MLALRPFVILCLCETSPSHSRPFRLVDLINKPPYAQGKVYTNQSCGREQVRPIQRMSWPCCKHEFSEVSARGF